MTLVFLLLALLSIASGANPCRFALNYSGNDILNDKSVRKAFLEEWLVNEIPFMKVGGLDQLTGMTLDGQRLDVDTGLPYGPPHNFTAPSKESLHVGVLALVLDGNKLARLLYTETEALQLLAQKIKSYAQFAAAYPGMGGFMPWVQIGTDGSISPTDDFVNMVPALDNGELFWAAFAVAEILKEKYPQEAALQQQWEAYWTTMTQMAVPVFYQGNGWVRAVTLMSDQTLPPDQNTYSNPPNGGFLDDPYEGELFVVMMYLFSNLTQTDKALLWVNKRAMCQPDILDLTGVADSNITVQKGFWFSSHEQWKYLMLPYYHSKLNFRIFVNGERARTWYSYLLNQQEGAPAGSGMWASVNGPAPTNQFNFPYWSDCGVPPIAFQAVTHDFLVTPYSVFPLMLIDQPAALAWLWNMIMAPRGQNCFGTTESTLINGTEVSPLVTWDSKITTVLSALGGLAQVNDRFLSARGLKDPFVEEVDNFWAAIFTEPLQGEDLPFQLPSASIPLAAPDFTSCNAAQSSCDFRSRS